MHYIIWAYHVKVKSILLQTMMKYLEFSTKFYYYLPFHYLCQFTEVQICQKSGLAATPHYEPSVLMSLSNLKPLNLLVVMRTDSNF